MEHLDHPSLISMTPKCFALGVGVKCSFLLCPRLYFSCAFLIFLFLLFSGTEKQLWAYQISSIQYDFVSRPFVRHFLLNASFNSEEDNYRLSLKRETPAKKTGSWCTRITNSWKIVYTWAVIIVTEACNRAVVSLRYFHSPFLDESFPRSHRLRRPSWSGEQTQKK